MSPSTGWGLRVLTSPLHEIALEPVAMFTKSAAADAKDRVNSPIR